MTEFKNEVLEVGFQIKRVKQISFFINEEMYKYAEPVSNVNLAYKIEYNLEKEFLSFILRVGFVFPKENMTYVQTEVQNVFEVKELKSFFNAEGAASLPDSLLISIVGLSLSHTRAIASINVAGTVFNETLLPLLDPRKVAIQFFGEAINTRLTAEEIPVKETPQ